MDIVIDRTVKIPVVDSESSARRMLAMIHKSAYANHPEEWEARQKREREEKKKEELKKRASWERREAAAAKYRAIREENEKKKVADAQNAIEEVLKLA